MVAVVIYREESEGGYSQLVMSGRKVIASGQKHSASGRKPIASGQRNTMSGRKCILNGRKHETYHLRIIPVQKFINFIKRPPINLERRSLAHGCALLASPKN